MMNIFRRFFLLALLSSVVVPMMASDTLFVRETNIPMLIERQDNVLFYLRIDARQSKKLNQVVLTFGKDTPLQNIKAVKLYYSGTEGITGARPDRFAPLNYLSRNDPGHTLAANRSYSILKGSVANVTRQVVLQGNQTLFPGINYFWVSLQMKPQASLLDKVTVKLDKVTIDGSEALTDKVSADGIVHRTAIGLRHAGDDGSNVYRIPGLATTNKGTLLGVYDVRYNNGNDLQEHINIGLSRSTDGGNTWEKMRLPLNMGEEGGLPSAQNGTGDPSILVDTKTNTVWIVAAWCHGMGQQHAWFNSRSGMDKDRTAQLVMVKSVDDGKTWSAPINITGQVKDPSWHFLLQGPGRGITMKDGTLVFPIQFIDSTRIPNAGIMYSKDRGVHWTIHHYARTRTTESQVAEVAPGVLMLNMRDDRGGSRAVAVTKDLGRTWTEHSSSRSALRESVCQASLIHIDAKDNVLGKDILLFSNPNTTKGRHHITVKASLDGGVTWPEQDQVLLDEDDGWGYSCLTMIDKETVGILYEGSVAQMTFQKIKLRDIIR